MATIVTTADWKIGGIITAAHMDQVYALLIGPDGKPTPVTQGGTVQGEPEPDEAS